MVNGPTPPGIKKPLREGEVITCGLFKKIGKATNGYWMQRIRIARMLDSLTRATKTKCYVDVYRSRKKTLT
jgi:hypothetical protein